MLELDEPTTICLHIRDVLLTGFGVVNNLLPSIGEFRLPFAVPFCFVYPPRVVGAVSSLVSPMPNPDFSLGSRFLVSATEIVLRPSKD